MEKTERGFIVYKRLEDTYGVPFRVQESSSAEERRVWIFLNDEVGEGGIHLNEELVDQLISALYAWKSGEGE